MKWYSVLTLSILLALLFVALDPPTKPQQVTCITPDGEAWVRFRGTTGMAAKGPVLVIRGASTVYYAPLPGESCYLENQT